MRRQGRRATNVLGGHSFWLVGRLFRPHGTPFVRLTLHPVRWKEFGNDHSNGPNNRNSRFESEGHIGFPAVLMHLALAQRLLSNHDRRS